MSHFKQRKEKNCLNCGVEVLGHYCQNCGQENVEPKQTLAHLISHFFNDVTHFDGKFFSTIGTLIRRPGFLTNEYVRGRRMSYLDPIRMYIFTSAVFFLLFFGVFHAAENVNVANNSAAYQTARIATMSDKKLHSYTFNRFDDSTMSREVAIERTLSKHKEDSISRLKDVAEATHDTYAYDSSQTHLPSAKRDNWFKRRVKHQVLLVSQSMRKDVSGFWKSVLGKFLHQLPQLLFVSLPIFAFILQLLYWRRKQFYYTSHGIFAIHLYVFTFITLLVILFVSQLGKWTGWQLFGWIDLVVFVSIFFYLYKAMRNFYQQGRLKTILKFLLLLLCSQIMLVILFSLFLLFNLATITVE